LLASKDKENAEAISNLMKAGDRAKADTKELEIKLKEKSRKEVEEKLTTWKDEAFGIMAEKDKQIASLKSSLDVNKIIFPIFQGFNSLKFIYIKNGRLSFTHERVSLKDICELMKSQYVSIFI
jgi:hypothetical protein